MNPSLDVVRKYGDLNVGAAPWSWYWCRTRPSVFITSNHGGLWYDTTTLSPEPATPQHGAFTSSTVPGVRRPPLTCTSWSFLCATAASSRPTMHIPHGPSPCVETSDSVDPVLLSTCCIDFLVQLERRRESGDTMTMSCIAHGSVNTFTSGRRLNLTLLKSEGENRLAIIITLMILMIIILVVIIHKQINKSHKCFKHV